MTLSRRCCGILLAVWCTLPLHAWGATYYVTSTGSDANPGSSSEPWRTIEKASNVTTAGDTVIIAPGTYAEMITITNPGTPSAPILYKADDNARVIIDAADKPTGLKITAAHIIIQGFEIKNAKAHGILATNVPAGLVVRDCKIYDNAKIGLSIVSSKNVLVENCLIYDNGREGIKAAAYSDDLLLHRNTIWSNGRAGVMLSTSDAHIEDSIIIQNATWGVDFFGSVTSTIDYSNVWGNIRGDYKTPSKITEGADILHVDPLLINPPSDMRLAPSSPCVSASADGSDIGYQFGVEAATATRSADAGG